MTTNNLPFELSPDAISLWLQSLSEKNSANSAVELNNVTKILRSNKSDTDEVLSTLIQLTPTILHVSNTIESSLIAEPMTKRSTFKVIKLCIQLLRNTSLAFCNICYKENLSPDEQNLAIYSALQLIGYSQRISTLFHESPSLALWGEVGKTFLLASSTNSTQQQISHKIKNFKDQPTIESVLKRNILFDILNPYQYSASQIKELFFISDQLASKLVLNPKNPSTYNCFHWNPNSKKPPCVINSTAENEEYHTTINTRELIIFMQSKDFSCNLDNDVLANLFDQLSGYQSIINTPIPSAPTISRLIIGFNNITEHLIKANKLKKIQQLSAPSTTEQFTKNMGIEPIPFEKNYQNSNLVTTPSSSNFNLLSGIKTVKTLQVKNDNFIIAEASNLKCSIADVVLFCASDLSHKLGVIRQAKITNDTGTIHILIEEIPGVPSTHLITSPQSAINQIISTQKSDTQTDLFFPPCKISNGTVLNCASGESFTLDRLIDYSSFFTRYQTSA